MEQASYGGHIEGSVLTLIDSCSPSECPSKDKPSSEEEEKGAGTLRKRRGGNGPKDGPVKLENPEEEEKPGSGEGHVGGQNVCCR